MGQIIFSDSEITIYRKKVPPLILVGLSVIIGIAALIPIFATGFRIFYGMGFHFGLIISYLLFWGITIYIFRIILWNTNGKEILNFKQDKIIYYADYGLFKDGRKEIHTSELFFEFLEQPE
ncbi:MAG TPA: hypothetical protein ENL09_02330, partial [Bacteroidetes bacterium]|nr:hypothetical protein [Bacteroidota bacterium]